MLGAGGLNKVFFFKDFHKYLNKVVPNMKLAFTNLPLRHNPTCVIQEWLRFGRVIIVTLAYIS